MFRKLTLCLAALILAAAALPGASAQPPEFLHYQGRLTDNAGAPLTTPIQVFFSLWEGGDATTAGSGAQIYSESQIVALDNNGVFEHRIGSGSNSTGSLDPENFRTSNTVFLQIAVGSVGNVVLPRTQLTSVGFAFVADYAREAGSIAGSGLLPSVNSVVDETGGKTIIGDMLRISGANLADVTVRIGGKAARIQSQNATTILAQVPAGIPSRWNEVVLIPATGAPVPAGSIDVRRLIVGVQVSTNSNDTFFTIDPVDFQVATADPSEDIEDEAPPIQGAFANQGSMFLLPTNNDSRVAAFDLTNPASLESDVIAVSSITNAASVAVAEDDSFFVVSDSDNDRLRRVNIDQQFPPYTDALFSGATFNESLPALPGSFDPRGMAILGNGLLLVAGQGPDQVIAYRNVPDDMDDVVPVEFQNAQTPVSVIFNPQHMVVTPDRTRAIIGSYVDGRLNVYHITPFGLTTTGSGTSFSNLTLASRPVLAPDGRTVIVAGHGDDEVLFLNLNNLTLTEFASFAGPTDAEDFMAVAVEPIDGRMLAVGTDESRIWIYRLSGTMMELLQIVQLPATNRLTYELRFQP